MTTVAKNLFERLNAGRPQQLEKQQSAESELIRRGPQPIIPPAGFKSSPSEKLLSWLINDWPNPVISLRDIRVYGPNCTRDPLNATSLTKTLTEFGWLIPVAAWRRDRKTWKIVREPGKTLAR
jgi:hypothetical protein